MDVRDIDFIEGYFHKKYLLFNKTQWKSYVLLVLAILVGSGAGHYVVYNECKKQAEAVAKTAVEDATKNGVLKEINESHQKAMASSLAVEDFRKRAEEAVQFLEQRKNEQENFKNELQKLSTETQQQAQQALARRLVLGEEKELNVEPHDGKVLEVALGPASDNSFAVITLVAGSFAGGGERVWVEKRDNVWFLRGHALQPGILARARCVRLE